MTDATVTLHRRIMPGIRVGSVVAQDGYTSKFGFKNLKGVVLTESGTNGDILAATISSGQATITVLTHAGASVAANRTIYFVAWGE